MRMLKLSALAVLTAMFFTACGDDVTKVTQETSGLEVVASADSLGKCTEERSGEMKFASKENAVYVCADSAWKNVSAAGKASCAAELLADSSGFKIVCDGDSVGVVFNGKDGSNGENGDVGKAGTSCTVEESPLLDSDFGRGGYQVVCGGDIVGTLRDGFAGEGCTLIDNGDGSVTQVCGADSVNLYKAFCAGKVYDPKDSVCHNERLYGFFEDARDGQVYRMVRIGTQTWMAQNLNYAYMPDTSSFCLYNSIYNSSEYCEKYGRLYTWSAAMDSAARFTKNGEGCGNDTKCLPTYPVRGVCPEGLHLPDTTEWQILKKFVAKWVGFDSVGYALKSTSGWKPSVTWTGNGNGSDMFGFDALPAGAIEYYPGTNEISADFWSSVRNDDFYVRFIGLYTGRTTFTWDSSLKSDDYAYSIRCIKDN